MVQRILLLDIQIKLAVIPCLDCPLFILAPKYKNNQIEEDDWRPVLVRKRP